MLMLANIKLDLRKNSAVSSNGRGQGAPNREHC